MEIVTGKTGSGKTTYLIKKAEKEGATIICSNNSLRNNLRELVKTLGYDVPIKTTRELFNEKYYADKYIIDDIENMFSGFWLGKIIAASVCINDDYDSITLLEQNNGRWTKLNLLKSLKRHTKEDDSFIGMMFGWGVVLGLTIGGFLGVVITMFSQM